MAPVRSADGATRPLVNSHQPYTGPLAWYEAVIETRQGWHVAGGFFPGTPFMLHGHNAHLGWANTVNDPDLIDVYKLTINPANPNQYQMDGQWRDFEKSDAKIRVKIWGPLVWTVHREVLYAAQGPVLKTDHGVFAIRYAGINEMRQPLQYYRLNKAATLAEWRAAMALGAIPSLNFVYADEKANIGYVYNGRFPVRKEGVDLTDLRSIRGALTPTAWIFSDPSGNQMAVIDQGPMKAARLPILRHAVETSELVHIGTGRPTYYTRIASLAAELDRTISFDPAQEIHYVYSPRLFRTLLERSTYFFGNAAEIAQAKRFLRVAGSPTARPVGIAGAGRDDVPMMTLSLHPRR